MWLCSLLLFDHQTKLWCDNENGDLLQRSQHALLHSVPLTLQQATTNPCLCQGLLDTHRHVGSVSWGGILPGSSAHKVLFVPSKGVISSVWVLVGLMETSSKGLLPQPGLLHRLAAGHRKLLPPQKDARYQRPDLARAKPGPGAQVCLSFPRISGN